MTTYAMDARRIAVIVVLMGIIATAGIWRLVRSPGEPLPPVAAATTECDLGIVSVAWQSDGERVGCLENLEGLLAVAAEGSGCRPSAPAPVVSAGDKVVVLPGRGRACEVMVAPLPGPARLALGIPIDINVATEADLTALPGIGPVLAEAIVMDREDKGPFSSVFELARVRGVGPVRLERISPYVVALPLAQEEPRRLDAVGED